MTALGSIFNIAGSALSAYQYGVEVTSNNIANVDTPGYSRQTAVLQASSPEKSGNLILGGGVEIDEVTSASDRFIERRLQEQTTSLSYYQEQNTYVEKIEQVFSTDSDSDVSSLLSTFWNSWQEVSNNPSGTSERIVLADNSALLAEEFNRLDSELENLVADLDDALGTGVEEVNSLAREVAEINQQIQQAEIGGDTAHTLRDLRNTKVGELSEYIDTTSFELDDGTLTVMVANGVDLVRGNSSFELTMQEDQILLSGSGDQQWNITDGVERGKIGGWIDMRDDVVAGYQTDLDALAQALIWQVNSQHSQGAGLENFESVSGTYAATDTTSPLATSGLTYQNKINSGDMTLWVYDASGVASDFDITIDPTTDSLNDLAAKISAVSGVTADISDENTFQITADSGYTFGFSDDTSNVLAALGINTFFTGDTAGNMAINETIASDASFIAAGVIDENGALATGDNGNATAIADLQSTSMTIGSADGNVGVLDTTAENYYHTLLGSMGTTASGITMNMETSKEMVLQLTNMRDSVSGVSLDEEMVKLITYQSAYAAAAKLITTADEMLDTLLSIK